MTNQPSSEYEAREIKVPPIEGVCRNITIGIDYNSRLQELDQIKTTSELHMKANNDFLSIPDLPTQRPILSVVDLGKTIDRNSLELVPSDIPMDGGVPFLYPVQVYGDSNCLPRSTSLLAYDTEENHEEMRLRIALEFSKNKERYLDESFYVKGNQNAPTKSGSRNPISTFAMCSEHFSTQSLTKTGISEIYDMEVRYSVKYGEYIGIWPLASLATILQQLVVSVYPNYAGHNIRDHHHRVFFQQHELN